MASRSGSSKNARVKEGTRLGEWVLREEIGNGSFAFVHRAKNLQRGGYAAVKCVVLAKLQNNKKLKENLYGEIKILKSINHPHIVPLFDCKDSPDFIFLIMEFCSMGDLSHFIKNRRDPSKLGSLARRTIERYPNPDHGGINEVLARHFIKQMSSAIEFLQTKNLIHRDLKPQNVLLAPSRQTSESTQAYLPDKMKELQPVGVPALPILKLADFGFARSLPPQGLAETLCGSPLYMAPEILRYEKYDAKADLWSVGTVTYEMVTGRPPFRAGNHVELLRNIDKCDDVIRFPAEVRVSSGVKDFIRSLLKRNPVLRTSFADMFKHSVVTGDIPGLLDEDREALEAHSRPELTQSMAMARTASAQRREEVRPAQPDPVRLEANEVFVDALDEPGKTRDQMTDQTPAARPRLGQIPTAPPGRTPQLEGGRNMAVRPQSNRHQTEMPPPQAPPSSTRPDPARRHSVATRPSPPSQHQVLHRTREEQERAAQDVADEREYVVVEKKAVEMNALADELQASPRIRGHRYSVGAQQRPARQIAGSAPVNNQVATTRAAQAGNVNRPDHLRRASFERRAKATGSASSAIAKALSMASGRLMNLGFSPPMGRAGSAPNMPIYSAFPAYPTQQSQLLLEDGSGTNVPLDDDSKTLQTIEETATRSDVVHGFAEVKFLQIAPAQPAAEQGLGVQGANVGPGEDSSDLPPEALVMVCEEALVLYVKALNLLSRAMDVAAAWWKRRSRGEVTDSASVSPKSFKTGNPQAAAKVNSVVQWVRNRFNETLAKAEFVSLKLVEAQKLLPSDHPCHPDNRSSTSTSASVSAGQSPGTPKDQANGPADVYISPGVTAERIMYQRAVEMSKSAAVNELMGENFNDCELGYITAIRMLEVVLETSGVEAASESAKQEKAAAKKEIEEDDGLDPEDRESVLAMLQHTRTRLHTLRKKMQELARRNSAAKAVQQRSPKAKPASLAPGNASAR